jgi:enediyne biosynthesis protein E3
MSLSLTKSGIPNSPSSLLQKPSIRSYFSWSRLRRQLLGLSVAEATFAKRGFQATTPEKQQYLEQIGLTFLEGYHSAIATPQADVLIPELEAIPSDLKGFAYEGSAMGLALLDSLTPWQNPRLPIFLEEDGNAHIYMGYVGLGWALARLPGGIERYLRKLDTPKNGFPDPLLGWLALDGYGFHQGYFYWRDYISNLTQPKHLSVEAAHVFDQGLGRSLWFVRGANPEQIAQTIQRFQPSRQADLWSGIGLACTYAGGVTDADIIELKNLARDYLPEIAQGAVFAAKARQRADNLTEHTERACQILCGVTALAAAQISDRTLEDLSPCASMPMYGQWRRRIQAYFSPEEVN